MSELNLHTYTHTRGAQGSVDGRRKSKKVQENNLLHRLTREQVNDEHTNVFRFEVYRISNFVNHDHFYTQELKVMQELEGDEEMPIEYRGFEKSNKFRTSFQRNIFFHDHTYTQRFENTKELKNDEDITVEYGFGIKTGHERSFEAEERPHVKDRNKGGNIETLLYVKKEEHDECGVLKENSFETTDEVVKELEFKIKEKEQVTHKEGKNF